jgi:hypothetical protein
VSTSTPQYGSVGNGIQSQLDGIRNGIAGAQSLLDQRKAAEAAQSKTGGKNVASDGTVTFKGILSSLLGASNPTKEQNRARKEMERIAAGNKAIADEAKRTSDMYGQEIARVGNLKAGAVAGNLSTGSQVVGSGNANLAANAATTRMDALAAAQKAALEGTAQQLTGQEQQANAFKPSLDAALTQQQQQIGGIGTAGGLAAPLNIPYSAGGFDPITGQQIAGGLGGYAGYNAAQQAFDLTGQYPDAGVQYDPNLSPQENLQRIQQAISSSNSYSKDVFGVPGQSSFAGASTAQTARSGYDQSFQTYQEINKQKSYADIVAGQLSTVMSQYGIGANDVRKLNEVNNYIERQFGSEGQSAFQTALAEAQRAYSSLLTIGGGTVPTEATAAANTILNPNATVQQINAAIQQLKFAGEARLQAQGSQMQTYLNQLQQTSQTQSSTGGGTAAYTSPSGRSYQLPY